MANVACSGSATPEVRQAEQEALDARTAYFLSDGIPLLVATVRIRQARAAAEDDALWYRHTAS
jgi:hypothetical protein